MSDDHVRAAFEVSGIDVASVMGQIEADVRSKLRERLVKHGSEAYKDEQVFDTVRSVLLRAEDRRDSAALLLTEILEDEQDWSLETRLTLASHRRVAGPAILFAKRRILLPLTRWLFEYTQENFRRQQRLNRLLMACVEELAIENAQLRRDVEALASRR
jgi:hypothetical protein